MCCFPFQSSPFTPLTFTTTRPTVLEAHPHPAMGAAALAMEDTTNGEKENAYLDSSSVEQYAYYASVQSARKNLEHFCLETTFAELLFFAL